MNLREYIERTREAQTYRLGAENCVEVTDAVLAAYIEWLEEHKSFDIRVRLVRKINEVRQRLPDVHKSIDELG